MQTQAMATAPQGLTVAWCHQWTPATKQGAESGGSRRVSIAVLHHRRLQGDAQTIDFDFLIRHHFEGGLTTDIASYCLAFTVAT